MVREADWPRGALCFERGRRASFRLCNRRDRRMFLADQIPTFVSHYGYAAIFCVVAIESAGVPFPGETTLLSAAIFAGHSHSLGHDSLNIFGVVAAAAAGAIVGDNIGFWVGRTSDLACSRAMAISFISTRAG